MRAARFALVFGVVFGLVVATFATMAAKADDQEADWVAQLAGKNEQPIPHPESRARGNALFFENADGTLSFKLIVANINNVFAAHIHCGSAAVAGPVGVTLYVGAPASGRFDGVLVTGTISAPDPPVPGATMNACGWTSLAQVITAMNGPDTYVNVHTNDGVAPANTGPGDFPGGEIRGQLRATEE
jgi:hypothetical protein